MCFLVMVLAVSGFALSFAGTPAVTDNYTPLLAEYMSFSEVVQELEPEREPIAVRVSAPRITNPQNPYERIESYLYTGDGERIFHMRETGWLMTESGNPITDIPPPSSDADSFAPLPVLKYDEYTQQFVNSANESLGIMLNSRVNRHYLVIGNGQRYARSIALTNDVFLINKRMRCGGEMLIYTFRSEYRGGAMSRLNFRGGLGRRTTHFRYYDMNGHALRNQYIAEMRAPVWWQRGITALSPILMLGTAMSGGYSVPYVEVLRQTTLGELLNKLRHATYHPWDVIECGATGLPLRTEDNEIIRVNPRTYQLTDHFGWALFNRQTGYPILYNANDIITTGSSRSPSQQQRVENAILRDSLTILELLNRGDSFYVDTVTFNGREYDMPVIRQNPDDDHNPDFVCMAGNSTDGRTNGIRPSTLLNIRSRNFGDMLRNAFTGGSGFGVGWLTWVALIAGVILLLVVLAILSPILTPIGGAGAGVAVKGAVVAKQMRRRQKRRRRNKK